MSKKVFFPLTERRENITLRQPQRVAGGVREYLVQTLSPKYEVSFRLLFAGRTFAGVRFWTLS